MADLKISQLTGATTPLAGTEVLPIVQSGSTVKVAVSDLTAGRPVSASTFAAGPAGFGPAYAFQVSNTDGSLAALYNNRTSSGGANFRLFKSRGTYAAPTVALSGDNIYAIGGRVYGRNSGNTADEYVDATQIESYVFSVDAQSRVSSALGFRTVSASGTITRQMVIDPIGQVGIGTSAPTQKVEVVGNQRFSGSQIGTKVENRVTAISVTGATTILDDAGALGRFAVVNGESGGNRFCDLILCSTSVAPTVVASFTSVGSPAARTYTRSGSAVQLAMASGTYDVYVLALGY